MQRFAEYLCTLFSPQKHPCAYVVVSSAVQNFCTFLCAGGKGGTAFFGV